MRAVWCLFLVSVAVVYGKNMYSIAVIPPERIPNIVKASSDCIEKLQLDKDMLEKYLAWELSDTESSRKYMYCIGVNSGYFANNGSLVKDEVLGIFGADQKDKISAVIDECNNKNKYDDKYEEVYRTVTCFRDKSGVQFKV